MAEYQVVNRHLQRMCKALKCGFCPLSGLYNNIGRSCGDFCMLYPERAEKIIMDWAAEHPEPKYPTWHQLLVRYGCVPTTCGVETLGNAVQHEIPEKAAKDLGIDPINS